MAMLVSVITITRNSEAHLEDTINSVLSQNYPDIEYIIVDGGSTDGTLDIIKKYEGRISKWVSEPDNGIAEAMNKGINMCTGEVIGIIHSDDRYEPGAISEVARVFKEHSRADVVHGDMNYILHDRTVTIIPAAGIGGTIWRKSPINHPTMFVRKSAYLKHGLFDVQYDIAMDYELITRFHRAGLGFHYINRVLATMRTGGASSRHAPRALRQNREIALRHGYSGIAVNSYYLFRLAEMKGGALLRALGLGFIARLYAKVIYPRRPVEKI